MSMLLGRWLGRVVTETKPRAPFKLRRASFKGRGLQPTCAALPGASCAIWPTKVARLDSLDQFPLTSAVRTAWFAPTKP
jgi:hypothetical protein